MKNVADWPSVDKKQLFSYLFWNSYRSERHKLFYVATPKVACTSIKWWFAALEGHAQALRGITDSGETGPDMIIHDSFHRVAPDVTHLAPEALLEPLSSDSYFRFAVVRNPYKRVFSAWQQKLLVREPLQIKPYLESDFFHRRIASQADIATAFEVFLEHPAINEAPSFWDVHWVPQATLLRPDLINYSQLVQIENAKELSLALAERLGESTPNPFESRRANESLIPYLAELITARSSELIRSLYADDFDTFGYSKVVPEGKEAFSKDQFDLALKAIDLVRGRHKRLGERSLQITGLTEAVTERDSRLIHLGEAVAERDARLTQLGEAVAERDGRLTQLGEAVAERDGRITQLDEAVAERDGRINQLGEAVAERDGRINQLAEAVVERDGRLGHLTVAVIGGEQQIEKITQELVSRDLQIIQLKKVIVERDVQAGEQALAIINKDNQIEDHAALVLEREKQVSALTIELDCLHKSTSWRITSPMRYLRRNLASKPHYFLRRTISSGLRGAWLWLPLTSQTKRSLKDLLFSSVPFLVRWSKAYQNWQETHTTAKTALFPNSKVEDFLERGQKILLISHEFSLTGAPRAVFYLAKAIYEHCQIRPEIISPVDGPIRKEFEGNGFSTIVAPWLMHDFREESEEAQFITNFDLVVVTSISSYYIVRHSANSIKKLIWWVHEDAAGFEHIRNSYAPDLTILMERCDAIWLGSPVCSLPVLECVTSDKVHSLLYGCEDVALANRRHESGRMVFTLVGTVEPRKGQDIFLSAIERLPSDLRSKALFRIIGSPYSEWSEIFHKEIIARARTIPEVECYPNMPFDELLGFYAETDVMVSASRADPMPIAITQGLMFSKPCLCSSSIGHARLLENGNNVLIFENESVQDLSKQMEWLLKNPEALPLMGKSGREAYEKTFLMSVFAKNVGGLVPLRNC